MKKIAFIVQGVTFKFFKPIIENIPPDLIHILYNHYLPVEAEELIQKGYNFIPFNIALLSYYDFIVLDAGDLPQSRFSTLTPQSLHGKTVCRLVHATDADIHDSPYVNFTIGAHKASLDYGSSKYWSTAVTIKEKELFSKAMKLPVNQKLEYTYTGPYHIGKWLEKRNTPKEELRPKLEKILGLKLDTDKPLVVFFRDEISDDEAVIRGLRKLSKHATVIYKTVGGFDPCLEALSEDVIFWKNRSLAPNLLRFSADFIFAGFCSGTFASSLMLGLNVIPYHTQQVFHAGRDSQKLKSYKALAPTPPYKSISHRCIHYYGQIFDIENTENLISIISSQSYWDNFYEKLPIIQKRCFGDYTLEGADVKTAKSILSAYSKGTFGLDGYLIKTM
ncbi:hypothetical protein [Maridesulfovibrio bastinii]|uniref:hypothetical protein n=1 Tax=Maridesulfovibrio bastinii TaxID=47157 RepID=UPI0003F6C195|nr:hypothetical protein [Maridesulfovibrio bastinii]